MCYVLGCLKLQSCRPYFAVVPALLWVTAGGGMVHQPGNHTRCVRATCLGGFDLL